ncbi:twin-arginine translocation signal domain-containing protein [Natranaeroarchaeum aerophilus]|uniref:Twin-arginine translocation signal domain-containing protein n=1 Tax=Natranaeroarchaeum aerophilus TaxID=2917711 RepID=A0AAE3K417_9EURY|nr:twin-arginine translocation signal domain-containing protein [Natranaeroarchaeum aerophilus]MCL9812771.1 twin-arginine translocation signal domain-containing protein [Natranaeroarchaeum aerophilus]
MVSRRGFLSGVASTGAVAIAGCSSSSVPVIGGDSGPEDAVEQYLTAGQSGDIEAANEVLHPESSIYPVEEGDLENEDDFTVNDIDQVSTRERVEWEMEQFGDSGDEATEEEIQDRVERLDQDAEEELDELGADDYAWVLVSLQGDDDDEDEEVPLVTVQDDGDWYLLL